MAYSNPIVRGFHPDPSICRVADHYYLVTSSFEYFPGVPVYHSRDLVNWRQIGHCLTRASQLPLQGAGSSGGIYAPTIRHHAGRFYMVTTNVSHGGNFYVWTEDPAGEWSEPLWVDQPGIDPSLYFEESGKAYFVSNGAKEPGGNRGAFQSEIDIATGRLIGACQHLWSGTGGAYPEGPHVFRRGEWYYVLMAEGGTEFGHMVTIARGRNINGPFTPCPHNPILTHRSLDTALHSLGHSDLFEDAQGQWWIVFLACRHVGYPKMHHLGRETCLAPVEWDAEGWPVVNGGRPVELKVETSRAVPAREPRTALSDDFDRPTLGLEWNFRRNPCDADWSLGRRKGYLSLRCSPATLNDVAPVSFVGRRQEDLNCAARVLMDFAPTTDNEEAGLTVLMNDTHHNEIVIGMRRGKRVTFLRRSVGTLRWEGEATNLPEGVLQLEVRAEPAWYYYSVVCANGEKVEMGKSETRHVSTELAGGFTGVYFGMYATAKGKASETFADFDRFEYVPAGDV